MKKHASNQKLEAGTWWCRSDSPSRVMIPIMLLAISAYAQPVVINPSFEQDAFSIFPGYVDQNGSIAGWSSPLGSGVNPVAGSLPFADNGRIPDGNQVAFIQANTTLSQAVGGFSVGVQYVVLYSENARNCCGGATPALTVTVGGVTVVPEHGILPVGGANSYATRASASFAANFESLEVAFIKSDPSGGDSTVLIDDVRIVEADAAVIFSFSPTNGAPGGNVVITGRNFLNATHVAFGGLSAQFTVNSSNQITAVVPAYAISGPISVTTPRGIATSRSSFLAAPIITSFSPASGAPGQSIAIYGENFSGASRVRIAGVVASFTVVSATEIRATVPATATTTGPIQVTTPAGIAASTAAFFLPPRISSFSPASGQPGDRIAILGNFSNITEVATVHFNGLIAEIVARRPAAVEAIVPMGVETGPISVSTATETALSTSNFVVVIRPISINGSVTGVIDTSLRGTHPFDISTNVSFYVPKEGYYFFDGVMITAGAGDYSSVPNFLSYQLSGVMNHSDTPGKLGDPTENGWINYEFPRYSREKNHGVLLFLEEGTNVIHLRATGEQGRENQFHNARHTAALQGEFRLVNRHLWTGAAGDNNWHTVLMINGEKVTNWRDDNGSIVDPPGTLGTEHVFIEGYVPEGGIILDRDPVHLGSLTMTPTLNPSLAPLTKMQPGHADAGLQLSPAGAPELRERLIVSKPMILEKASIFSECVIRADVMIKDVLEMRYLNYWQAGAIQSGDSKAKVTIQGEGDSEAGWASQLEIVDEPFARTTKTLNANLFLGAGGIVLHKSDGDLVMGATGYIGIDGSATDPRDVGEYRLQFGNIKTTEGSPQINLLTGGVLSKSKGNGDTADSLVESGISLLGGKLVVDSGLISFSERDGHTILSAFAVGPTIEVSGTGAVVFEKQRVIVPVSRTDSGIVSEKVILKTNGNESDGDVGIYFVECQIDIGEGQTILHTTGKDFEFAQRRGELGLFDTVTSGKGSIENDGTMIWAGGTIGNGTPEIAGLINNASGVALITESGKVYRGRLFIPSGNNGTLATTLKNGGEVSQESRSLVEIDPDHHIENSGAYRFLNGGTTDAARISGNFLNRGNGRIGVHNLAFARITRLNVERDSTVDVDGGVLTIDELFGALLDRTLTHGNWSARSFGHIILENQIINVIGSEAKLSMTVGSSFRGLNLSEVIGELLLGSGIVLEGPFKNEGRLRLDSAGQLVATYRIENKGELSNTPGAGQQQQRSPERIDLAQSPLAPFYSIVTSELLNEGRILPGGLRGTAILSIDGALAQTSSGTLEIDIGGHEPGAGHDQLFLTGSALIGGALVVRSVDNYVPPVGQEFTVLAASSVSGQFSEVDFAGKVAGRTFAVRYGSNAVTLVGQPLSGLQYATWRDLAFVTVDEANNAISDPDADPDGDGLRNAIEYAFGLDPQQPDANPVLPETFQSTDGQILILSFPWADGITDLGYQVSTSSDLQSWSIANTEVISAEQREGIKRIRLKVIAPPGTTAGQHFARLEVRQSIAARPNN